MMKLRKQTFEIRYEHGYRYLDECGQVMLILEKLLPDVTGHTWMPLDVIPSGAKLKCPELEIILTFDTWHMVLDQDPAETEIDFTAVAAAAFSKMAGRVHLYEI